MFSYVENDDIPNSVLMSADATAAMLEIITLDYGGSTLLGNFGDSGNTNGYRDIQDLKNASLAGLTGIDASGTKIFTITVQLEAGTSSDFQSDGITITMTFTLNQ